MIFRPSGQSINTFRFPLPSFGSGNLFGLFRFFVSRPAQSRLPLPPLPQVVRARSVFLPRSGLSGPDSPLFFPPVPDFRDPTPPPFFRPFRAFEDDCFLRFSARPSPAPGLFSSFFKPFCGKQRGAFRIGKRPAVFSFNIPSKELLAPFGPRPLSSFSCLARRFPSPLLTTCRRLSPAEKKGLRIF